MASAETHRDAPGAAQRCQINSRDERQSCSSIDWSGGAPGMVKVLLISRAPGRISWHALAHKRGIGAGERKQ